MHTEVLFMLVKSLIKHKFVEILDENDSACFHLLWSAAGLMSYRTAPLRHKLETFLWPHNQMHWCWYCSAFQFCCIVWQSQETLFDSVIITVPIRRNLTGNAFANGNGTDTERVQERERNGYRTGSERIQNGYRTEMERIQNGYESQKSKKAF